MRSTRALHLTAAVVALLFAMTPVGAQSSATPAAGITVTGRGVVRVRADVMRVLAYIGPLPQRTAPVRSGTTADASGGAPAPADVDGAAEAIAKALRDGGVADATSGMTAYFNPVNRTRAITGTLHNPTRATIDALVRAGNLAAAPYPNVTLQNLLLSFYVSDCDAAEARAQAAAFADARSRAERVAHAAGVRLGAVVAVNEPPDIALVQSCQTRPDVQFLAQPRNDSEGITSGDVFVTTSATVTFSIVR
jgi:uncharacterized protein YggE